MVIVSSEWIKHSDEQKSMTTAAAAPSSNVLMMAAAAAEVFKTEIDSNTVKASTADENAPSSSSDLARIVLLCQPNSHPFQTRNILLDPNVEYKVGRSIARSRVCENNAIFDCKVLSRNHAVLWYADGKFFVKDTKSSNGTFINERKIGQSEAEELASGDVVKFGVDVVENSRKEVHGCIIACVKLYMPDGRESISIGSHRSSLSGDANIPFDELHRLYHCIQETTQREKQLESKLHDLQSVLDVTRKGASSCWQAMIDEDRLLNRIDVLENKLHYLQKNFPENQLKEEILKMQDEKFLYQNTAKEALRKVYQEQLDAMTKLASIERALCSSEDECSLLREQILYTQQSFQDVNSRLLIVETEFKDYKEQAELLLDEAKVHQIDCNNLKAQLEAREQECETYKEQIKLIFSESEQEQNNSKNEKSPKDNENDEENGSHKTKATIMKWLENSNINQDNESKLILNAICNSSDASDDGDAEEDNCDTEHICTDIKTSPRDKIANKLQLIQTKLDSLESEMLNEFNKIQIESQSQFKVKNEDDEEDEEENPDLVNNDGNDGNIEPSQVFIKSTISVLQEAFKDISQYVKKPTVDKSTTADEGTDYAKIILESNEEIEQLKEQIVEKVMQLANTEQTSNELNLLKLQLKKMEDDMVLLRDENQTLTLSIKENEINRKMLEEETDEPETITSDEISRPETNSSNCSEAIIDDKLIDEELAAINNVSLQHEEELILFKEKYEIIVDENLHLKNEINEFKFKNHNFVTDNLNVICMYGAIVIVSILFYFLLR